MFSMLVAASLLASPPYPIEARVSAYDSNYEAHSLCYESLAQLNSDYFAIDCNFAAQTKDRFFQVSYLYPYIFDRIDIYRKDAAGQPSLTERRHYGPHRTLLQREQWQDGQPDGTWLFYDPILITRPIQPIAGADHDYGRPRHARIYDRYGYAYAFDEQITDEDADTAISDEFKLDGSFAAYISALEGLGFYPAGTTQQFRALTPQFTMYIQKLQDLEDQGRLPQGTVDRLARTDHVPQNLIRDMKIRRETRYAPDHCELDPRAAPDARYITTFTYWPDGTIQREDRYYLNDPYTPGQPHADAPVDASRFHGRQRIFNQDGLLLEERVFDFNCQTQQPDVVGIERIFNPDNLPPSLPPEILPELTLTDNPGVVLVEGPTTDPVDGDVYRRDIYRYITQPDGSQTPVQRIQIYQDRKLRRDIQVVPSAAGSQREGQWLQYDEQGRLIEVQNYQNGDPFGEWTEYVYRAGQRRAQTVRRYDANSTLTYLEINLFDREGRRLKEERYRERQSDSAIVPHGLWRSYDNQGRLIRQESYSLGTPDGFWYTFDYRVHGGRITWRDEWLDGELMASRVPQP